MITTQAKLSLQDFWVLPPGETNFELIDGEAVPKMAAKKYHSSVQRILLRILENWNQGHIEPEWSIELQRHGANWVPCPNLTYISYARLPESWSENTACPLPPDLAVEIISPGQTFGQLAQKAEDYVTAGVQRVWVIDTEAQSLTVFYPSIPPHTYTGEQRLEDLLLPGLSFSIQAIFQRRQVN